MIEIPHNATIDSNSHNPLGRLLSEARKRSGLSIRDLESSSGVARSTILRLETGELQTINAQHLSMLAPHLGVPLADLYEAAGIEHPAELPSFTPYLRGRYQGLPTAARSEIESAFRDIADKYGYHPDGPPPGKTNNHN